MPRLQDLTGQRFGQLTVISRAEDHISPTGMRTAQWLCRCDCGAEKVMLRNVLKRAKSCGCERAAKAAARAANLAGQRFGRWQVIERAPLERPLANGTRNGWRCRCDCGTERVIPTRYLTSGMSTSCGCQATEKAVERIRPDGANCLRRFAGTMVSKLVRTTPNSNSKTGVRGVYWSPGENNYVAKIGLGRKSITVGRFRRLEDAKKARTEAEAKLYAPIIEAYQKANTNTEEDEHYEQDKHH